METCKPQKFLAGDSIFFRGYHPVTNHRLEARVVEITPEDLVKVRPYDATTNIGAGPGEFRLFLHEDLKAMIQGWYRPAREGGNTYGI